MAVDKKISYEVQGGVKNYLGKQKQVTAPVKWKSSPDHPETELAYITKAEKDLLVKKDLHGSLKGGVNRGPSGIMSLNGFGSADESQNVSGSQVSAAETGSRGSGMSSQDRDDFRSAAIAAGAGQRVNPGFFDNRNTVSPAELARAKQFSPDAFKATRGGGLMNLLTGGGFLGNIIRGLGQKFGLGKSFNAPYDRPQFAPGFATNTMTMGNNLDNEGLLSLLEDEEETNRPLRTSTFFDDLSIDRLGSSNRYMVPFEGARTIIPNPDFSGDVDIPFGGTVLAEEFRSNRIPDMRDLGNPTNDPRVVSEESGLIGGKPTPFTLQDRIREEGPKLGVGSNFTKDLEDYLAEQRIKRLIGIV